MKRRKTVDGIFQIAARRRAVFVLQFFILPVVLYSSNN